MRKLAKSFKYACTGIWIAWKQERSFRIEIAAAVLSGLLGWYLHISVVAWAFIVAAIALVLAMEVVNTALEELCDKFQPEHDPHIGKIKDLGAGAVFVTAIGALVIGLLVFGSYLL